MTKGAIKYEAVCSTDFVRGSVKVRS